MHCNGKNIAVLKGMFCVKRAKAYKILSTEEQSEKLDHLLWPPRTQQTFRPPTQFVYFWLLLKSLFYFLGRTLTVYWALKLSKNELYMPGVDGTERENAAHQRRKSKVRQECAVSRIQHRSSSLRPGRRSDLT